MLKYVYRIIILLVIFIASLVYFSRDIKEVVFNIDNTTVMEEVTFPLVTIGMGEDTINLLHGYSSNLSANAVRESLTPIKGDKSLEIQIDEKDYDIKKLNYEIREFVGNHLIEEGSISVFVEEDDRKTAKIRFDSDLKKETEYAVKITLITSNSKKMYYYQRVKVLEESYLSEKLNYVLNFTKAIKDKETVQDVKKYLEPENDADNSSLAYVNIHSSIDLIGWGSLEPELVTEIVPTVLEIYESTALIHLDYIVESKVTGVTQQYRVKEIFRVRYTKVRMYLLDYERWTDTLSNPEIVEINENQINLGVSPNKEIPIVSSANGNRVAFVEDRELWFYNLEESELVRVFSFRQRDTDYIRDIYDQHDIRILNMDAEGNMDFIVYGYMNRGQYEGRVAVILYRYYSLDNRIEERAYIPVEETYQTLKENLGEFTYVNAKDVFYFQIYNNIYSYNIITNELVVLARDVAQDNIIILNEHNSIAWQDSLDPRLSKKINIMNMEKGTIESIAASEGYNIRLMGMIDNNIIYGFMKEEDVTTLLDGSILTPLVRVCIAAVDKTILKNYEVSGYYVTDIQVRDNVVELFRVKRSDINGKTVYSEASMDFIMNQENNDTPLIEVISQYSEQALTQRYMALPKDISVNAKPAIESTVNTVISKDPTLRLDEADTAIEYYYPYVYSEIAGAYTKASDAIREANEGYGSVRTSNMEVVWERIDRPIKSVIAELQEMELSGFSGDSLESCIKILLASQKTSIKDGDLLPADSSVLDSLRKYSRYTPVSLTGCTLEEILYYICKGVPVMAMIDDGNAVIIYGFDAYNIMVIKPEIGKRMKIGLQDSTAMFEEAGNIFISYLIP